MPTYKSRHNWSDKRKESVRRGLRRSWQPGGAHYERFCSGEVDADTVRKRALWDRRGQPAFSFSGHEIRHSMRRSDAYDVFLEGKLVCSGGRVVVGRFLGAMLP